MSHADKNASRAKRAKRSASALRSDGLVGARLSLTPAENALLLGLVRHAANEPSDVDYAGFATPCAKVEAAQVMINRWKD